MEANQEILDISESNEESTLLIKVFCVICREYAKTTDKIYSSSKCGHTFHGDCIHESLKNEDYLCPECHTIVNKYIINRLFLNVYDENDIDYEVELEPIKYYHWMKLEDDCNEEEILQYIFQLGSDEEGDAIYAARCVLSDECVPAYFEPKTRQAFFCWCSDFNFAREDIELLRVDEDDADYEWVEASNGDVPKNSLVVGFQEGGAPLYFARHFYKDKLRYGNLIPEVRAGVIFEESEINTNEYEVLTRIPRNNEVQNRILRYKTGEKEKIKVNQKDNGTNIQTLGTS